ncbi:MAG: hypothetical protein Pars93KO_07220 [Parasphingorhabdus sp.]
MTKPRYGSGQYVESTEYFDPFPYIHGAVSGRFTMVAGLETGLFAGDGIVWVDGDNGLF